MMKKTLLLASAAVVAMGFNAAEASMNVTPYVGLDYVYSNMDMKHGNSHRLEDKFNSLSANVGAKFHPNFGIEAYYQQSDTEKKHGNQSRFFSYGADLTGYLPVTQNLELIGSLGIGQYEFRAGGSEDDLGYRIGLGAQYNLSQNWAVRGIVREVFLDKDVMGDTTEFSAGIRYSF